MTNREIIDQALRDDQVGLIDPAQDGWSWEEDPVEDSDLLEELICEVIHDAAEIEPYVEDSSFSYEYGSIRGVHGGLYMTHDGACAVIGFVGAPNDLPQMPSFQATHTIPSACDGEHSGKCNFGCQDHDVDVDWSPQYQERRDGTLYVVYSG